MQAEGRGGSAINFADGATVPTEHIGALAVSPAEPLTLAAGDFDGDGVADLLSGYAPASGDLLTLHRGNVESIFPNTAAQPPPFFPEAKTFAASETFDLPNAATALAVVSFGENGFGDLAIAASNELIFVNGRDRQLTLREENRRATEAVISRHGFASNIIALTTGRFTDGATTEIIVLTEGSALHSVSDLAAVPPDVRKVFDFPAGTSQDFSERLRREREAQPRSVDKNNLAERHSLSAHQAAEPPDSRQNFNLVVTRLETGNSVRGRALVTARVSSSGTTDDLILLDKNNQLQILSKNPPATAGGSDTLRVAASFDGEVVAALPMRLNKDGLDDIVFLSENQIAPSVALTMPAAIFTVNSTGDADDINPGNGICETATGNGICILRAAITSAAGSAGADEIRFNIPGTPPFTITPSANFGSFGVFSTVTIDGTTQPGFAGTPVIEINGTAVNSVNGITFGAGSATNNASNSIVRGLVINRFTRGGAGINIGGANLVNNVRVEGCFVGTDVTGTSARGNGSLAGAGGGIVVGGGDNHTIGGTTAAARNLISGNNGYGLDIDSTRTATVTGGGSVSITQLANANISAQNASVNEGNSGSTSFNLPISLSSFSLRDILFDFMTANGTATAGSDDTASNERLTVPADQTSAAIPISVLGDNDPEPDETFFVNLSNPVNGNLLTTQVVVTIINDDGGALTEVTGSVRVARSGLAFSRVSRQYVGTVTVTNTSASNIAPPLQLVFDNLTSGVTLANASGTTTPDSPTGGSDPLITINDPLAPGQSVTIPVRFNNPANGFINHTPRVFSGSFSGEAAALDQRWDTFFEFDFLKLWTFREDWNSFQVSSGAHARIIQREFDVRLGAQAASPAMSASARTAGHCKSQAGARAETLRPLARWQASRAALPAHVLFLFLMSHCR